MMHVCDYIVITYITLRTFMEINFKSRVFRAITLSKAAVLDVDDQELA
jgi:hypothetical protein